jgi:uncharacterized repeat protein (TIGR03803 family)
LIVLRMLDCESRSWGTQVNSKRQTISGAIALTGTLALFACSTGALAAPVKVLHAFCAKTNCQDGSRPEGALIMDSAGNLYGTTRTGGATSNGTVFELSKDPESEKWHQQVIYDFCRKGSFPCLDGSDPNGPLIIDTAGNLYGTTTLGGYSEQVAEAGIAYELMPNPGHSRWKLKVLYTFCAKQGCPDGNGPFLSGLAYQEQQTGTAYDGASALYGTAWVGGKHDAGIAFRISPVEGKDKWQESVLYDFCSQSDCADGQRPSQRLVADANGHLYGVTGCFCGDVLDPGKAYELSPSVGGRWHYTLLHDFCEQENCPDGDLPNGLALDSQGNLLGTTYAGGTNDSGVIFNIVPNGASSAYQVLYNFCSQSNCADGEAPDAGLTIDSRGNREGTTRYGGDKTNDDQGGGTVFRLGLDGAYKVLHSFCAKTCSDGENPQAELLLGANKIIFGTTLVGGKHQEEDGQGGTVFELDK